MTDIPAFCQHLVGVPGLEVETETGHIRVGANTGVTEQIPGATDFFAAFNDGNGFMGIFPCDVAGRTDAGQSRANDDDAQVCLGLFNWPSLPKGSLAIP